MSNGRGVSLAAQRSDGIGNLDGDLRRDKSKAAVTKCLYYCAGRAERG